MEAISYRQDMVSETKTEQVQVLRPLRLTFLLVHYRTLDTNLICTGDHILKA